MVYSDAEFFRIFQIKEKHITIEQSSVDYNINQGWLKGAFLESKIFEKSTT